MWVGPNKNVLRALRSNHSRDQFAWTKCQIIVVVDRISYIPSDTESEASHPRKKRLDC